MSENPNAVNPYVGSQEADTESSSSGCKWGLAGLGGCLVGGLGIPLVIILILFLFGGNILGNIGKALNPSTEMRVVTTQTLVNSVMPLGQLVSVNVQLAKADVSVAIQSGALNACGREAKHVVQGTIEAGINLTGFDEEDVHYDVLTDTYTLTVPAPQLTSCRMDYIRQYTHSTTVCSVDWDEARLLAQYTSLQELRDDAIEQGILERAEEETQEVLVSFIQALTGSNVILQFEDTGDVITFPQSCNPEPPDGWVYDAELDTWTQP